MPERYLGQLEPGMDVCDLAGDKVGTLAHVYRHADAVVGPGSTTTLASPEQRPDEILEVKTGFLGLGSHFYIPLSAVQEVLNKDCLFISHPKHEFEAQGWHEKPAHLAELS
jgi:hypothetical protein